MKKLMILIYGLIVSSLVLFSCSEKDDNDFDASDDPVVEENQSLVEGKIQLPENIDPTTISIISPVGTYDLKEDRTFKAVSATMEKQLLIAENSEGEILLASLNISEGEVLNAKSTTRAIVGMAPWTAFVSNIDLNQILDEMFSKTEYISLENAVEEAIERGSSPLTDANVLQRLQVLFSHTTTVANKSIHDDLTKSGAIPEISYAVEPSIVFSDHNFTISNDEKNTAIWGVEVFNKQNSLTGKLMLEGHTIAFSSYSNIGDFINGNYENETAPTIEVPAHNEYKYNIHFGSPSKNALNPDLSSEAARFNIYNLYEIIFNASGIDLNELNASEYFNQGCIKEIFNATTNELVGSLTDGKLTAPLFLDRIEQLFLSEAKSFSECSEISGNFPGSTTTGLEKYITKLSVFLEAYNSLEVSSVVDKMIDDMLILEDIQVCRQVIAGKVYPCFSLVTNPEHLNGWVEPIIAISVGTRTTLDFESEENGIVPVGAPVHWDIIQGNGDFTNYTSVIGPGGISTETEFIPFEPEDGMYIVRASVRNSTGVILDEVTYEFSCDSPGNTSEYCGILGEWTMTFDVSCETSSGSGYPDNYTGPIIFHSDYTVTLDDDSDETSVSTYTLENGTLTITSTFQKTWPDCGDVQEIVEVSVLKYDSSTHTFNGTIEVEGKEISTDCMAEGHFCSGTVTLKR